MFDFASAATSSAMGKVRPPQVDDYSSRCLHLNRNTVHAVAENTSMFDQMHGTEYSDLVRNEINMWSVGQVLLDMHLRKHYSLDRIALGLRWLISDWMMKNAAVLVSMITKQWSVRERAVLASKLSTDWPIVPHTSLFCFALIEHYSDEQTRVFVDVFMEGWPDKSREKLEEDLQRRLRGRQLASTPQQHKRVKPKAARRPSRKESILALESSDWTPEASFSGSQHLTQPLQPPHRRPSSGSDVMHVEEEARDVLTELGGFTSWAGARAQPGFGGRHIHSAAASASSSTGGEPAVAAAAYAESDRASAASSSTDYSSEGPMFVEDFFLGSNRDQSSEASESSSRGQSFNNTTTPITNAGAADEVGWANRRRAQTWAGCQRPAPIHHVVEPCANDEYSDRRILPRAIAVNCLPGQTGPCSETFVC